MRDIVCGDPEIRSALRTYLLATLAGDPEPTIIDELGLCREEVRVDLAVVNRVFSSSSRRLFR